MKTDEKNFSDKLEDKIILNFYDWMPCFYPELYPIVKPNIFSTPFLISDK